MARRNGVSIQRTVYKTFRGADFSTDPSLVDASRSPLCTNIVADGGGMPQKRAGYRTLHRFDEPIYGLFAAAFDGTVHRLAHAGTKLYKWDETDTAPVQLMTGLPEHRSRSVYLKGKLWIVTGEKYIVYDGQTAQEVKDSACYIPTTVITRMPEGGGVTYENVNMLTPYRKNAFQTDGEATEFLLDSDVDAQGDVRCWIWGEAVTAGFTVDRAAGTVTFDTAPPAPEAGQTDGLVVQFPHTVEGYAERIGKCSVLTTYGLGTNDRLVLAGNPDLPNVDYMSALEDPTYFPDLGYAVVGAASTAIQGYCRVGSLLGIVKEDDGQDSTVFLRSGELNAQNEVVFSIRQAITGVGAVAPGSFAALLDDPLFLSRRGVMAIASNAVTSEKLAQNRSFYVNARLVNEPELAGAEAVVWKGLYLLSVGGGHIYVLDARAQKSYRSASLGDFVYECYYWEDMPAECWLVRKSGTEEALYFGTADGRVCKVSDDLEDMSRYSDDGEAIRAVWATKYDDDGTPALLKTVLKRGCCVTIKPYARSSATVYYRTDRSDGTEQRAAGKPMDILDFADIDFERFTFNTDDSPQEIFLNRKIKNYKRLQLIVRNDEPNEGFGVYEITKHFVVGNYAKK